MENANVLTAVLDVFDSISGWFSGAISDLIPMFYAEGTGLTFIGVLTVAALGIGVILMLVRVIGSFLNFSRG